MVASESLMICGWKLTLRRVESWDIVAPGWLDMVTTPDMTGAELTENIL